jgi:glutamine amidotransferase
VIVIVDYQMGNPGSVRNLCDRIGVPAIVSGDPHAIANADRLILPGVGHYSRCIDKLDSLELRSVLAGAAERDRKPILGVCMGMQVMAEGSDEGPGEGLRWIRGRTRQLRVRPGAKVPHIGWAYVEAVRPHPLVADLPPDPRFYFVHSFVVDCADTGDILLKSHYAGDTFVSAFVRDNIAGVQFHVEKSHVFGMRMIANFAAWTGTA